MLIKYPAGKKVKMIYTIQCSNCFRILGFAHDKKRAELYCLDCAKHKYTDFGKEEDAFFKLLKTGKCKECKKKYSFIGLDVLGLCVKCMDKLEEPNADKIIKTLKDNQKVNRNNTNSNVRRCPIGEDELSEDGCDRDSLQPFDTSKTSNTKEVIDGNV